MCVALAPPAAGGRGVRGQHQDAGHKCLLRVPAGSAQGQPPLQRYRPPFPCVGNRQEVALSGYTGRGDGRGQCARPPGCPGTLVERVDGCLGPELCTYHPPSGLLPVCAHGPRFSFSREWKATWSTAGRPHSLTLGRLPSHSQIRNLPRGRPTLVLSFLLGLSGSQVWGVWREPWKGRFSGPGSGFPKAARRARDWVWGFLLLSGFGFFFASEARLPCPPLEPLLCRQPGSEAGFGFSEFSGSTLWGPHQVLAHLSGPGAQALEEISVFLTFFKKTFIGV